jgi:hypothetical protein
MKKKMLNNIGILNQYLKKTFFLGHWCCRQISWSVCPWQAFPA